MGFWIVQLKILILVFTILLPYLIIMNIILGNSLEYIVSIIVYLIIIMITFPRIENKIFKWLD